MKRLVSLLLALSLVLALTACGSKADDSADSSDANTDNQTGETVTVKLGVVGGIYDDLWASAKAALADEGIDLEIVQFSDYVTPNNALANGDIDLNAFQHAGARQCFGELVLCPDSCRVAHAGLLRGVQCSCAGWSSSIHWSWLLSQCLTHRVWLSGTGLRHRMQRGFMAGPPFLRAPAPS